MCPDCHEPLIAFELKGIEIDHCLSCGGTWLDAGELEMIAGLAGTELGAFSEALSSASAGARSKRRCPRCNKQRVCESNPYKTDRPEANGKKCVLRSAIIE